MQYKDLSKAEDARQAQGAILIKPEQEGGKGRQREEVYRYLGINILHKLCFVPAKSFLTPFIKWEFVDHVPNKNH